MHLATLITALFLSNSLHLVQAAAVISPRAPADNAPELLNPFETDIELTLTGTAGTLPPANLTTRGANETLLPTAFIQYQGDHLIGAPRYIFSDWSIIFFNDGTLHFYTHIHNSAWDNSCITSYVIACAEVDTNKYMYIQARDGSNVNICYEQHDILVSQWNVEYELLVYHEGKGWDALWNGDRSVTCRVRLGEEAKVSEVVGRLRDSMEGKYGALIGETVLVE